jgi:predicted CXXCH cytochrome family protein
MKKLIVLLVLAVVASPAFAGVSGTPHDLSAAASATTTDEICVFCHTPHGSASGNLLWNRGFGSSTFDAADLYNSLTLEATSNPNTTATVPTVVAASDAPLCLSCHDGSQTLSALTNPPNAVSGTLAVTESIQAATNGVNLGTSMTNDHPIGMNYAAAQGTDGGLNASPAGVWFNNGNMWCSSCHDVHDNTNGEFLLVDNSGSNLCLACHNK